MPLQKWSDQIWISKPSDEPAFSEELEAVTTQLRSAEPMPSLVVDLSEVRTINSTNLAQLLRLRELMGNNRRRMKLAGPSDSVWTIFLTSKLDKVFEFAVDTTTALTELQLGA
jgi:anti-anti-sigma factor